MILLDASVMEHRMTGVARATQGLYAACLRARPDLDVAAVHRRPLATPLPAGMRDVRLAEWLPGRLWRRAGLRAYLALRRPRFAHFPWNDGVVRGGPDTRTVLTLHDVIPAAIPELHFRTARQEAAYRRRTQANLDRADLVITVSDWSRRDILRHFRVRREPVVVHNASELPVHPVAVPRARAAPPRYYLYYGGYDVRKGLDELVRVFRRLHADGALTAPLLVAGVPHYFSPTFRSEMGAAVQSGAVAELGYVSDGELTTLLRDAEALIYPSRYEGFGYPPLEAMAQGCAVITTRVSSLPEICGGAALYVAPGDEADLARAVTAIDRDPALRGAIAARGPARARLFTWERAADRFLAALDACARPA